MLVSYRVIGRNIRDARKNKGMTQAKVAEQVRLSQLHYGRLERGDRRAALEQIAVIAQTLDVSVSSLLEGCVEALNAERADRKTIGAEIDSIAAGCKKETCEIMVEICRVLVRMDK